MPIELRVNFEPQRWWTCTARIFDTLRSSLTDTSVFAGSPKNRFASPVLATDSKGSDLKLKSFVSHTCEKKAGRKSLPLTRRTPSSVATFACLLFLCATAAQGQTPPASANRPAPPGATAQKTAGPSSGQPDASLAEAQTLLQNGRVNAAEVAVREYLKRHADTAEGHFLLGYILFRQIQTEANLKSPAEDVKIPDVSPSDSKSREEKAKASLAEFTEGAKYHDPSAFDLKIVALDYVLLGDYADADKWLTRMLGWTPDDSAGWYYLGRTKYNENRFEEAIHAFEQCLKLDPRNLKVEDNLGLSYAALGRNEEAAAAYQQAIAWQSQAALKNSGPYIDLGRLLLDQNRPKEAVSYLLQAIEIAPREARAHELLGKAYTWLEQLPKAQTELEKAIELSPQSANLHCVLAPVYRKQGLTEKAKIEYDRCAALTGSHSVPETPRP